MEEVVTKAATTVLDIVLGRVSQELNLALGFKDDMEMMVERLQKINAILNTCGVEIYPTHGKMSDPIQLWLRNVQHIANEAENIIDLIAYEKVQQGLGSKIPFQRRIGFFFSSSNPIIFRQSMGHRISSLNKTIKEVEQEGKDVVITVASLQTYVKANANASNARGAATTTTTTARSDDLQQIRKYVEVSNVVGRDEDEHKLVKMLCNSSFPHNQQISVVALVGIGGMGKTVLAKKVLENVQVKAHFTYRIWVVVSEDFNIAKIFNDMLAYVDESNGGGDAVRKLREKLIGKRYLLVLDNVWNTKYDLWSAMKSSLESIQGSKESMILAIARDNIVASTMQASIFPLSKLTDDNSWSLFEQVAFSNTSQLQEDVSAFKSIGLNIVRKCKGVPLAIKTIGGILRSKTKAWEWREIENSELWKLPQDEGGILPSLKLSFHHLPHPSLKKCFTFCAFGPKGLNFEKYDVKDRWMALGFIQHNDRSLTNVEKEDIAEQYFDYLLSISFFMVHRLNEHGEASHYILHDLVYDLARSLNMHERFILEVGKEVNNVRHIQHLTVPGKNVDISPNFPSIFPLENLHSLDINKNRQGGLLLRHVKYLRILCLVKMGLEVLPKSIARLKCLKFLDLSDNPITVIPEWITELYNLQSLYLFGCEYLSDLPRGLGNLVNLQHLGLEIAYCPAKGVIRQLSQLQIVPPLQLSEGGFQIAELEKLHHIRGNLEIKGLQLVKTKQEAEKAHLLSKSRVDQVCLIWDNEDNHTNHEEILKALHPNPHLKKLLIKGFAGDSFPSWISRFDVYQEHQNVALLQKIQLVDCGKCKQLPTLGDLPYLKILEITKMDSLKCISPEFYCGAELILHNDIEATGSSNSRSQEKPIVYFPNLKELRVRQLANLAEWCDPATLKEWTIFPSLEVLAIEDCPILMKTPKIFPSLKKLKVKNITSNQPLLDIMSETSNLPALDSLHIEMVRELTCLPPNLAECACLQSLIIDECPSMKCLSERLSKLSSLQVLKIMSCRELVSLPSLNDLRLLRELEISNNISLRGDLKWMLNCKSLEVLWIYCCPKVKTLPDLKELSRLSNLCIIGMTWLINEPSIWLYTLPCLKTLFIGGYAELNDFPDISRLLKIASLQILWVYGWKKLQGIPEQLQQFKTLQNLIICDFENLKSLPDWIQNLSSLEDLELRRCKKLKKLASSEAMKRLTKLKYLEIENCPLLEENIKPNGSEYQKITHLDVEILAPSTS